MGRFSVLIILFCEDNLYFVILFCLNGQNKVTDLFTTQVSITIRNIYT